ncbi:uncharacterized protein I206_102480 [Kwoniella pini CBS 10737]|uniref:Uncharacterized protein n=1 Tax=Kwoniella pini CBS 10737 TaxID=1296096 RepID=A0A1B9I5H8_9TREE|nr:uncharacterized protein I206_02831 [Kwoniella pini CBS 10737]OCF50775.1 hypothetical protein I206_02831 [Kwoniella pini CBS 10737]
MHFLQRLIHFYYALPSLNAVASTWTSDQLPSIYQSDKMVSVPPNTVDVTIPSTALIAIIRDLCALISLTIENSLSFVNYLWRFWLSLWGLERYIRYDQTRTKVHESGKGRGIVVLGANEATGQSLTLALAKIGYTVFPLIPLPSPSSPPTSSALTNLLLTWSGMQKRLRARYPGHCGGVVPVIIDPEGISDDLTSATRGDLKRPENIRLNDQVVHGGRFKHAGETVRAYCKENKLILTSIICINRPIKTKPYSIGKYSNDLGFERMKRSRSGEGDDSNHLKISVDPSSAMQRSSSAPSASIILPNDTSRVLLHNNDRTSSLKGKGKRKNASSELELAPSSLILSEESTLSSLYRSNILDPLAIIKELSDLLSVSNISKMVNGRIIFINGSGDGNIVNLAKYDQDENVQEAVNEYFGTGTKGSKATRFAHEIQKEMMKTIRWDLSRIGVEVCEVLVGPMAPKTQTAGIRVREESEDSNDCTTSLLRDALNKVNSSTPFSKLGQTDSKSVRHIAVTRQINLLKRLYAVDDALLFASVRRAIEDKYVRVNHKAGLSAYIDQLMYLIPYNIGFMIRNLLMSILKLILEVIWIVMELWREGLKASDFLENDIDRSIG